MAKVADKFQTVLLRLRGSVPLRSMLDRAFADSAPRALAVMGEGASRDSLQGVFRDAGWKLEVADNSASALARQRKEPLPIILYERELTESGWRHAVSLFSRLSPRPCVLLLSRSSDKNLWEELVRCGGFDLLRTPIDRDAVIRTVSAGWSIWRSRYTLRQLEAQSRCKGSQAMTPLRTA
jgi:DNA-binding NtrC family response regulator